MESFRQVLEGCVIQLDMSTGKFEVNYTPEDESSDTSSYATYPEAKQAVINYRKAKAKAKLSISMKAVTEEGKRVVITGVHVTQRTLTLKPKQERSEPEIYPVVTWVEDAIREILKAKNRIEELEGALDMVKISHAPKDPDERLNYSRFRDRREITKVYAELEADYKRKTELAKKLKTKDNAVREYMEQEKKRLEQRDHNRRGTKLW